MTQVYEVEEKRHSVAPTGLIIPIWLASLFVVAGIAGGGWLIKQQLANSQDLAVMTVKMELLTEQIKLGMDIRYTEAQAASDFKIRDQLISHLYETVNDIKANNKEWHKRVRDLEMGEHNHKVTTP